MGETPGEDVIHRAAAERGRLREIVGDFYMAAILADFKIYRRFFF
jgi:hypothetical protein